MSQKSIPVLLAFLLLVGVGSLAVSRDQPARPEPQAKGNVKLEYKAIIRTDIEALAPKPVREKKDRIEGSNAQALTEGLNVLAAEGWELVTIEPYSETQWKDVGGTVTLHRFPTYIFKRPK